MSAHLVNLKKNVWFAIAELVLNVGLLFASYRLLILFGGVSAVGLWSSLFAWTSIIAIADVGMANSMLRFIAIRNRDHESGIISTYIETGIIANLALFCVLALGGYIALYLNLETVVGAGYLEEARAVLPAMFLGFVLSNVAGVILCSVNGLHLGYVRSQITVFGNVLQLVAVVFLVPTHGVAGLAWSKVIQHIAIGTIAWLVVRRHLRLRRWLPMTFRFAAFREMLSFSLLSQLANMTNGLFEPTSKLLVSHFYGLDVLGVFELAFKTVFMSRYIVVAGVSASLPAMTAQYQKDARDVVPTYNSAVRLTSIAILVMVTLLIVASPIIAYILLGHISTEYSIDVIVLSFGIVFNVIGATAYNLGTVTGKMRNNIVVSTSVIVFMVILGFIVGSFCPNYAVVMVIALSWAIGGIWIKILNEALLPLENGRSIFYVPWRRVV